MTGQASRPAISVVLPAYNEEEGISGVVADLRKTLSGAGVEHEILVVDDGSSDQTAELAEKAGARVIRHPVNVGYGKSLLTGFSAAEHEWVLMLDADGSYPPADALKLLPFVPDFDMVVGARQGSLFWGSPFKAFLRAVYLRLASFVAGIPIPDANSGLRVLRKSLVKEMPVLCYGYSLSTTMTLSFLQGGRFVRFEPVSYASRKGRSKVRPLRDILRTLQIMVQVILYYNPLKFAVYAAFIPFLFGLPYLCRLVSEPGIGNWTLWSLYVLGSLAVFLFGCFLEGQKLHR